MFNDSYVDIIYRVSIPSILDTKPYLTICITEDHQIFIQMGPHEEKPEWHLFEGTEKQARDLINSILDQKIQKF